MLALALVASSASPQIFGGVIVEPSIGLTRATIEVPSNGRVAYSYRLSADSELVFALRSSRWRRDPLAVWLVDDDGYRHLREGETFDYYAAGSGLAERRARFVFAVPETGVYHVVLDNAHTGVPLELDVYAYAAMPALSAAEQRTQNLYAEFYREIATLFDFDDIDVIITRCGRVNAYTATAIVICRELDEILEDAAAPGVRLFVLMHELAHVYMQRWGYRSIYRNQFMADRLAATLIELMDREQVAREAAEWFAAHELELERSSTEAPFSLSGGRARRIAAWLREPAELDWSWTRRIVLPKMRTAALETLLETRELNARTRARIEVELAQRRAALAVEPR